MNNEFIKVSLNTLDYQLGNLNKTKDDVLNIISENKDCSLLVFNQLTLSSNSLFHLINHNDILMTIENNLKEIIKYSFDTNSVIVLGLPLLYLNKVYDVVLVIQNGKILGGRNKENESFVTIVADQEVRIDSNNLYNSSKYSFELVYQNDLKTNYQFKNSDLIILFDESAYTLDRNIDVECIALAKRMHKIVLYVSSSKSESTSEQINCSYLGIYDHLNNVNHSLLKTNLKMDINVRSAKYLADFKGAFGNVINFNDKVDLNEVVVKKDVFDVLNYQAVINLQVLGLKKRLEAIKCNNVVLGFSGGLDSTLALIVLKELQKEYSVNIHCLLLPCFATSKQTFNNALALCNELQIDYQVIDISNSVTSHLNDLDHPQDVYDVVFENAQARERTQVLFDYANKVNGIVIGTGDLSEIALGFATFNGDHMANYNVNANVPKSLIRKVIKDYSIQNNIDSLLDILKTPISPELIPGDKKIVQQTETIVGPYELIDFLIYYYFVCGNSIKNIYSMAKYYFDSPNFKQYFKGFFTRLFRNQFKRNTKVDGVKIFDFDFGHIKLVSDLEMNSILNMIDELED